MKKYLAVKENPEHTTHLKIEVYYHLGGMNYFTYKEEKRGYYLSVSPVEKHGGMESYVGFSGIKQLVKGVARKSAKAEAEAEKIASEQVENLIAMVCGKHGLVLA